MYDVIGALKASAASGQSSPRGHVEHFTLEKVSESAVICLDQRLEFGYLNEGQGKVLTSIMEAWPSLQFEGVAYTHSLIDQISKVTKSHERKVRININIYGPEKYAAEVGQVLSRNKAYLQRPDHCRENITYRNPHVIEFEGITTSSRPLYDVRTRGQLDTLPVEERDRLHTMMVEVREALNQADEPTRTDGDRRLLTQLLRCVDTLQTRAVPLCSS